MNAIWKRLLKSASDLLPDYNDYLLLEFRRNKLLSIRKYMEQLFIEAIRTVRAFDGKLTYVGSVELTPDERIEHMKKNKIIDKRVNIRYSSFSVIRYDFMFNGQLCPVYLHLPYMIDNAVISQDTQFFPVFPVIERGSMQRTQLALTVSPLRGLLRFYRNQTQTFCTEGPDGRPYTETLVTAQIHQRKAKNVGKGGKDPARRLPIILYHLARFPFTDVLSLYGFKPDEFVVTCSSTVPDTHAAIRIRDGYWLQVAKPALDDMHKRRFIASYLEILSFLPRYELRDLYAKDGHYYKTVLGKYTYPDSNNAGMMYENAIKHLETTDTFLDIPTKIQLANVGIQVDDIYGLLREIFFNIDDWLVGHEATNLYNKKIGSLEKLLSGVVTQLNKRLFDIINNKKQELKIDAVKRFTRCVSQSEDKITGSEVFRANPSICNDNWLLAIGAQRYRSTQTTETNSTKKSKASHQMSKVLLKAHPSQLVVETIMHLPPSSPVVSGSINPFVQIDQDGNFLIPPWADEIAHVFD